MRSEAKTFFMVYLPQAVCTQLGDKSRIVI
jgi:hypothetical protein